jgi:heme-degrading monooxygenase HmoA
MRIDNLYEESIAMVIERVDISVIAGRETEFESVMERSCALLAGASGCTSVLLLRCVERPSRYSLHLQWNSIADHQAFTKTQEVQTFREIVGPFFSERPAMEHFQPIHRRE